MLPLYSLPPKFLSTIEKCCIHASVIDRQDGFPEPIREEMPWLVRKEPGVV